MKKNEKDINTLNAYAKLIQQTTERVRAQLQGVSIQIKEALDTLAKQVQISAEELNRGLIIPVIPASEQIQKAIQELPPRTKEAILVLGKHGWYLDSEGMSVPDLHRFEQTFSKGNTEEAELALIEHFEGRVDEIENFISKEFPNRENLIRAAFNAHRKSEYELAIPVLFSQTDGICKEVGNKYLFTKDRKKYKHWIAVCIEQIKLNALEAALLSPFTEELPIWLSLEETKRAEGFNQLNRHMVMHGESLNYGTKANSLKAISLLNYVAEQLPRKIKIISDNYME